jgi:hypothetical protein
VKVKVGRRGKGQGKVVKREGKVQEGEMKIVSK